MGIRFCLLWIYRRAQANRSKGFESGRIPGAPSSNDADINPFSPEGIRPPDRLITRPRQVFLTFADEISGHASYKNLAEPTSAKDDVIVRAVQMEITTNLREEMFY